MTKPNTAAAIREWVRTARTGDNSEGVEAMGEVILADLQAQNSEAAALFDAALEAWVDGFEIEIVADSAEIAATEWENSQ